MRHTATLRSSAYKTGHHLDLDGLLEPTVDSGIPAGRKLVAVGREATKSIPDATSVTRLAEGIGDRAAVTAVEVAGAFTLINRIVETTGQPIVASRRARMLPYLEQLGATRFPHTDRMIEGRKTAWRRVLQGMRH